MSMASRAEHCPSLDSRLLVLGPVCSASLSLTQKVVLAPPCNECTHWELPLSLNLPNFQSNLPPEREHRIAVKNMDFGAELPGFKTQLLHFSIPDSHL